MTRGVAHSSEVRARAESLLLAGHKQSEVCELTGLPRQTVSRLAAGLGEQLGEVGRKTADDELELVLTYFRTGLRALVVQAEVLSDPEYCRAQDAAKLAIAHGVLADKLAGVARTAQALGLIGAPAAAVDAGDETETLILGPDGFSEVAGG